MATFKLTTENFDLKLVTDVVLSATDSEVYDFLQDLMALHAVVPLSEITCDKKTPTTYEFELITVDSRVWTQIMHVPGGATTFDIPDPWSLSELQPLRPIRERVWQFIETKNLTKLTVSWT